MNETMMHRLATLAAAFGAVAVLAFACSKGGGDGGDPGGTANGGASVAEVAVGTGGAGGDGEVCEEVEADADPVPLDLVLVLDRSASMETNGLWDPFVQALSDYISSPSSDGVEVGFAFYPDQSYDSCPAGYLACQESLYGYDGSLQVPLTALPAGQSTLLSALSAQSADGDCTPTFGALKGTLDYAMKHQDATPARQTVVVLACEGDFDGCPPNPVNGNDADVIASLASNALHYNGVRTFAIAIQGANVADLDKIALAGGTDSALDVTADITAFQQKLLDITTTVLSCDFLIPEQMGAEFDPTKVNMVYTPGDGSDPEKIPQVPSSADCGDEPGWFYDNPAMPTKISLCPASCDLVQSDDMAQVNVAFGCPTIIK